MITSLLNSVARIKFLVRGVLLGDLAFATTIYIARLVCCATLASESSEFHFRTSILDSCESGEALLSCRSDLICVVLFARSPKKTLCVWCEWWCCLRSTLTCNASSRRTRVRTR